ncbi:DUF6300 family protein [Streptomyces sp. CC228A]|uniref:DUF6300 family protein n=1 Tax=Streptomyces sp. CC228A TaxID=2898186 RepID=UPI001F1829FF|nr:DUF6300 family protein [Streptomyces sp. CC228A]
MAHVSVQRSDDLPPCSRCNGSLILAATMPVLDAFGKPITLELCRACDASDATAAGALVRFFKSGGGQDTTRTQECADLVLDFQKEAMAAHGYVLVDKPKGTTAAVFPPHTGAAPKGVG